MNETLTSLTPVSTNAPSAAAQLAAMADEASALLQRGRLSEALARYQHILRVEPRHFEALHLSGVIALQSGDASRALDLMARSIDVNPRNAIARFNHGVAARALGRREVALASYDAAVAINPQFAAALSNRGLVLTELGRLEEALTSFERAVAIAADSPEGHFNRANVLQRLGQHELAVTGYDRAIEIRPGYVDALYNRGESLRQLGQTEAAVASYDRTIALSPAHVAAHINRGNLLKDLGHIEAALDSYESALALDPADADTHCNRGVLLQENNRVNEAIAAYDRAIALRPGFAAVMQYRGYARLLAGDYENGWTDLEWRWKNERGPVAKGRRSFQQRLWLGDHPIAGKRILLHAEQGFGDALQFCRYATCVADLGATVILEAPAPLIPLLATLDGVRHVVPHGKALPAFDCHCPLMSLPLAFRTTLTTIPARVPYLSSDPQKVLAWRERLGTGSRLRVGLVWSGGFRPEHPELWSINGRRNIPLARLAPLAHPEIDFISLQKGEPAESELAELVARGWDGPPLIDHTSQLKDFSDTAALIQSLDLVLSVDTSTAHLAGALGKPVWIMNRFDTCWRWLLERSDSPWYPTVRLYRQERPEDWAGVIERVRADLHALAPTRV